LKKLSFFNKPVKAACKPNSVPDTDYSMPGNGHSSMDAGCPTPLATYPGSQAGSPQAIPYLVLHRMGFTKLPRSPGELVRSYRTISPLPVFSITENRRFIFCCTFLRVAATPRYGASCPAVFGLSSGFFCPCKQQRQNNPATVRSALTGLKK
jgi:hypothetical protein